MVPERLKFFLGVASEAIKTIHTQGCTLKKAEKLDV
jgi:hypothetical protein